MGLRNIQAPTENRSDKGSPCAACQLTAALPADEAAHLNALFSNPSVRYGWLSDQLRLEGYDVPDFTIRKHVRGQCAARVKLR